MARSDDPAITAKTRAAWDASAGYHRDAASWVEWTDAAAKPGFSVLDDTLSGVLTSLEPEGRTVGQLCCNNAREVLSVAALGARPLWGVDGSAEFLEQASELARLSGQTPDLICADVYDLPRGIVPADIVLITIGVLNWMPDLERFCRIAASLIAPGGHLLIYETHPVLEMFDPVADDPFTPAISYFERQPHVERAALTYDGAVHRAETESFWFQHTMGEIVTSVAQAGLRLQSLTEYPHSNRETDYDRYEGRAAQVPMCYTLVAQKAN